MSGLQLLLHDVRLTQLQSDRRHLVTGEAALSTAKQQSAELILVRSAISSCDRAVRMSR